MITLKRNTCASPGLAVESAWIGDRDMSDFLPPSDAALTKLKEVVGDNGWRASTEAGRYFEDPRGRFTGQACLILMPDNTEDVSRIVRICNEEQLGLIPYGGGTGVVAGQLSPDNGDAIILSLERMNRIRHVDARRFRDGG